MAIPATESSTSSLCGGIHGQRSVFNFQVRDIVLDGEDCKHSDLLLIGSVPVHTNIFVLQKMKFPVALLLKRWALN